MMGHERPSNTPVRLTKATKVKDPETGKPVTLAAGTELSGPTAEKLGLAAQARGRPDE
jgi:hypothetical protein